MFKTLHIILPALFSLCLIHSPCLSQSDFNPLGSSIQDLFDLAKPDDDPLEVYQAINAINDASKTNSKKSLTNYTHKLDSTITWNFENNSPYKRIKGVLLYDSISSIEKILVWERDQSTNSWVGWNYSVFRFNEQDQIVRRTYNLWDGDYNNLDESNPNILEKRYYNNDGLLTRLVSQNATAIAGGHINNELLIYYDEKNKIEKRELFHWDSNSDSLILREEHFYTHNNQNQLENIVRWHLHSSRGWELVDSTHYEYNTQGQLIKELEYNWNPFEDSFFPFEESIYIYNPDGTKNRDLYYGDLRESNNTWKDYRFDVYNYHDYGSLSGISKYDSLYMYYPPENYYETNYVHDETIDLDQVWLPRYTDRQRHYFQNHMLLTRKEFRTNYDYDPVIKYEYHYTPLTTSIVDEPPYTEQVNLFPNPTSSGFIRISIPTLTTNLDATIFNINGQAIFTNKIHNNEQLSIENLERGIYIIRISDGDKFYSGKIVKM